MFGIMRPSDLVVLLSGFPVGHAELVALQTAERVTDQEPDRQAFGVSVPWPVWSSGQGYAVEDAEGDLAPVVLLGDEYQLGDRERDLGSVAVGEPGPDRVLVDVAGGVGER